MNTPRRWSAQSIAQRDQLMAHFRENGGPITTSEAGTVMVRYVAHPCDGTNECYSVINESTSAGDFSDYLHVRAGLDITWTRGQIATHTAPHLEAMARAGWIRRADDPRGRAWTAECNLVGLEDMPPLRVMESGR